MDKTLQMYIDKLNALNFKEMYNGDFFLTWEKSDDEIEAVYHPHVNFDGVTALAERHIDALKKQNADCNRGEIVV